MGMEASRFKPAAGARTICNWNGLKVDSPSAIGREQMQLSAGRTGADARAYLGCGLSRHAHDDVAGGGGEAQAIVVWVAPAGAVHKCLCADMLDRLDRQVQ